MRCTRREAPMSRRGRCDPVQAARSQLRTCGVLLVLCSLGLLVAGCPTPEMGSPPAGLPTTGASHDSVIRELIRVEHADRETRYRGQGWTLALANNSGWRRSAADGTSTLQLVRTEDGIRLDLRLRVYPIRQGMPLDRFVAAHAMWMEEEGGPAIEYEHDEQSQRWRGYAIHADREAHYAFLASGDRAYVIQESASSGVLSKEELEQFDRSVAAFRCYGRPRPGTSTATADPT